MAWMTILTPLIRPLNSCRPCFTVPLPPTCNMSLILRWPDIDCRRN